MIALPAALSVIAAATLRIRLAAQLLPVLATTITNITTTTTPLNNNNDNGGGSGGKMRGAGARGTMTSAAAADRNRNRRDAASRIEAREQAAHTRAGARLRHNLPSSTILRDVCNPVTCVFAWATVWSMVHRSLTEVASGSGVVGLGLFAGSSKVVCKAYEFADGAAFDDG